MRISIIISLLLGLVPVICAAPQPVKLDGGSVALQGIQTRNKVHKGTTEAPLKFTVTFSGEAAYGKVVKVRDPEPNEAKILKQLVGSIFAMEVVKTALGVVQATVGGDPLIGDDTLVGDDDGQILFDITGDPNTKECIHGVMWAHESKIRSFKIARRYSLPIQYLAPDVKVSYPLFTSAVLIISAQPFEMFRTWPMPENMPQSSS
ncbi:hypothetical protein C8J55DRAFT_563861 [Lentinula edodes]|uniref:Uncharacterized protein n=1 Tax=Lentinula lateritia TaxID=40482 RepID=A0A9W9A207_9AGAR|nr:hypothetical protein C8J55DRAFT_563861 [Lentinula edodes]